MVVVSKKELLLLKKADNGCVFSQYVAGCFFHEAGFLFHDPFRLIHYFSKLTSINFSNVRFKDRRINSHYYLHALLCCAENYLLIGDFEKSKDYVFKAIEFESKHSLEYRTQLMFKKYETNKLLQLIDEINLGLVLDFEIYEPSQFP